MFLTDEGIPDPFFSRHEETIISLLLYYLEDRFQPFKTEEAAYKTIVQNPDLFQTSLNIFQKAFAELPETSRAKQVFMKTPFVQSINGWEQQERMVFSHTMLHLRKRPGINGYKEPQIGDTNKINHPFELGPGSLHAGGD